MCIDMGGRHGGRVGDLFGIAKACPARAWRREMRHQACRGWSLRAPYGMDTPLDTWMPSPSRVETLSRLVGVSVTACGGPSAIDGHLARQRQLAGPPGPVRKRRPTGTITAQVFSGPPL